MSTNVIVEAKKDITIGQIMDTKRRLGKEYKFIEFTATLQNGVPVIEIQEL